MAPIIKGQIRLGSGVERRAWIVEEQSNPSTDNYVLPALEALGCVVERGLFDRVPPDTVLVGATVVFVRYVPEAWRTAVSRLRPELAHVVYFMDDDLLNSRATDGLPLAYRWKIWRLATRHRGWLIRQGARFWVSTPLLAEKYASFSPSVVLPAGVPEQAPVRRIFYHGSASHGREIEWLKVVVGDVLRAVPSACFEIIGTSEVQRLYADLPRVTVVHPMKWPAYLSFTTATARHIGLAPLLDSEFNSSRSYTRFLDHTRCGAVGLYSEGSANSDVVTHRHDGLVLAMQQSVWTGAILELLDDDDGRTMMAANARQTASVLRQKAIAGYSRLDLANSANGL